MRQITRSKLKKWGIGAGCTLTAALIFNQVQHGEAFAAARKETAAAAGAVPGKQEIASQDRVRQEFDGFKEDTQRRGIAQGNERRPHGGRGLEGRHEDGGSSGNSAPSISVPSSPSASSKPTARSRHS